MKENLIRTKTFAFALRVVSLYKLLSDVRREFIISKQLLRSGTSIGAMVRESEQAESSADFIHKLAISLKEAHETDYWIELLFHSHYLSPPEYNSIKPDLTEILKLLTSIIKTTKTKNPKK